MKKYTLKWIFLISVVLAPFNNLQAGELPITNAGLGFIFRSEYSRGLGFCHDYAVLGSMELNDIFTAGAGFSLGGIGSEFNLKAFGSGHYAPFAALPLRINLAYILNAIPEYEMNSHSILPWLSWDGQRVGIALGVSFRFTNFFGSDSIYEPVLSVSGYFNFWNGEKFTAGIKAANFNEFYTGNFGSLSIGLDGSYALSERYTLTGSLELIQSGMDGLSTAFYGAAFTGGVRFLW